jgi:hypothetical protein
VISNLSQTHASLTHTRTARECMNTSIFCMFFFLHLIWSASNLCLNPFVNRDAISVLKAEDKPQGSAVKLTELAYSRKSMDNITCIVVQFNHGK